MQWRTKGLLALVAIGLAGCAGGRDGDGDAPRAAVPAMQPPAVSDTPVRLGEPYMLGGQRYTPVDQVDYDEVGYASWYGSELEGRPTANGEPFNPEAISAAHRTLPLPSYVEVTRLDTGATILVRVNDRGPADPRRLIDLSAGAARQLGIADMGSVPVRVRRVNPVEAERLALRRGQVVPERLPTPDSLLSILRERAARLPVPQAAAVVRAPRAPAPPSREIDAGAPAATADRGGFAVQLGAFSDRRRAEALASRLGARVVAAGSIFRVRFGPFATEGEAQAALEGARRRGHSGGVVVRDQ